MGTLSLAHNPPLSPTSPPHDPGPVKDRGSAAVIILASDICRRRSEGHTVVPVAMTCRDLGDVTLLYQAKERIGFMTSHITAGSRFLRTKILLDCGGSEWRGDVG